MKHRKNDVLDNWCKGQRVVQQMMFRINETCTLKWCVNEVYNKWCVGQIKDRKNEAYDKLYLGQMMVSPNGRPNGV